MEDVEFSAEFCRFIQTTIPAVDAAEVLLLFRSRPTEWVSAAEASARLAPGMGTGQVLNYLEAFESRGLLTARDDCWQYLAGAPLAEFADRLAQAYAHRPVTLVRIIYALRDSKIQSFADAFKLRRN